MIDFELAVWGCRGGLLACRISGWSSWFEPFGALVVEVGEGALLQFPGVDFGRVEPRVTEAVGLRLLYPTQATKTKTSLGWGTRLSWGIEEGQVQEQPQVLRLPFDFAQGRSGRRAFRSESGGLAGWGVGR